ncbi:phage tailspike protein [Escherichia coli]
MTDITANVVVSMPSQLFTMARSFKAVANGKIYIGKIDTDPVNPENQIQVYVENEDGSHVPVSQPIIINAAGYPVYNGQIAKFVTVQGHSMAVYDAYGTQQFYFPNVLKYDPDQFKQELESKFDNGLIPSIINYQYGLPEIVDGSILRTLQSKIDEFVSVRDFGAMGDGVTDDTISIQKAIDIAARSGKILVWGEGIYLFRKISSEVKYGSYNWIALGRVKLVCTEKPVGESGGAINLSGSYCRTLLKVSGHDVPKGERKITLDNIGGASVGDLIVIRNKHIVRGDNRGSWQEGQMSGISEIIGNTITLDQNAQYYYRSGGDISIKVTSAKNGRYFTALDFSVTNPPRDALYRIDGITGANAGITKIVTGFDDLTKSFTVGSSDETGFPYTPAVGDEFLLTRQAEAWIVYPATVNISGDFILETKTGLHTTAKPNDKAMDGLVLTYCINSSIRMSSIHNFPNSGLTVNMSNRVKVMIKNITGANRVWDGSGGTGNAVSLNASSFCLVDGLTSTCSRRGVDIAGSNWSSFYNKVRDVTVRGGGTGFTGQPMFPHTGYISDCYGVGSHAGAVGTIYENCELIDCSMAYTIRGFDEVIQDGIVRGFSVMPIRLYYGSGAFIDNVIYTDGFTETAGYTNSWTTITDEQHRKMRPSSFIVITDTWSFETVTVVKNCIAKSIFRTFCHITTKASELDNLHIADCTCYCDNYGSTTSDSYLLQVIGDVEFKSNFGLFKGCELVLVGANNTIETSQMLGLSSASTGVIRLGDGMWYVMIPSGDTRNIPLSKSASSVLIDVFNKGNPDNFSACSVIMGKQDNIDHSPLANINKKGVEISNSIGAPGKVISLTIYNGDLYISNGYSGVARFLLRAKAS